MRLERADGTVVCETCVLADSALGRMKGLLGRRGLHPGEGLLIRPAGSIHMFFMRFPIDAVFLDRELRVIGIAEGLRPWRVSGRRGARAVLEIASGQAGARGVHPGQRLLLVEKQSHEATEG
jgi:uncharacterized membrane protein (UPF0127 family)